MFVKRFLANDMQEAIRKINREFGPEAVIIENKRVRRKGILGLFQKKMFEVVAAYEPNRFRKETKETAAQETPKETPAPDKTQDQADELSEETADSKTLYMSDAAPSRDEALIDTQKQLGMQVQELREIVREFTCKISSAGKDTALSPDVLEIYQDLLECDVQEEICKEIAVQTEDIKSKRNIDAKTVAQQLVLDRLGDPIPLKLKKFEQNVLLFVGPTGAGKTTTLAKLAGRLKYKENLSVGLINTDTYRVGAMEHVRIYSEIMDIPAIMAYTPEELKDGIARMADKDVVLIDTAGKNPRDPEYQRELRQYIEASRADEVFLVLSVVMGSKTCRDTIRHYSFIDDYKLILTKLDEVGVWGNVLNIADYSKKGISYITNGQNVPDDIRDVDTYRLVAGIFGDGEMCYD